VIEDNTVYNFKTQKARLRGLFVMFLI